MSCLLKWGYAKKVLKLGNTYLSFLTLAFISSMKQMHNLSYNVENVKSTTFQIFFIHVYIYLRQFHEELFLTRQWTTCYWHKQLHNIWTTNNSWYSSYIIWTLKRQIPKNENKKSNASPILYLLDCPLNTIFYAMFYY